MRYGQLLGGVALGLLAGYLLFGGAGGSAPPSEPGAPVDAAPAAADADELERLRASLALAEAARARLEQELAGRPPAAPGAPATPAIPKLEAGLRAAGLHESEIESVNELYDEVELERLYLRDQAKREGWLGRPRYYQQMRELDGRYAELRDEYGDERFDRILYSLGRPNRVVVKRVMRDSTAEEIGIQQGDLLLAYENERLFAVSDLRPLTHDGRSGETVVLDVERDGRVLRLHGARGPLGIQFGTRLVEPGR